MNPAFSVVVFTTIAGAAQGMVVALALTMLGGVETAPPFAPAILAVAAVMLMIGLGVSFLHLGRPERAWRAATMWRTSWLSREVIVLPALISLVGLWGFVLHQGAPGAWTRVVLPCAAVLVAALLWYCTAMIYACLRFIEEWAHVLTFVNFVLVGLSSGFIVAAAAGSPAGEAAFVRAIGPGALVFTLAAWASRMLALRRNARIRHQSTLQSATGVHVPQLVQISMGMSAGSFNTREFFHDVSRTWLKRVKLARVVLGFALPALLAACALASPSPWLWLCAVLVQAPGLIADRWLFFAQAKHPQNLYYQVVS